MKTKCFILILLSCLFFSLYSCGKSGKNINSSADKSSPNEPLTYELGKYDIQNKTEIKNKKNYYYLNVSIPVTNTSSTAIIPTFTIEYTIQDDTFTKEATVFPFILAPNETGTISLETGSDRDDINFKSINEQTIKTGTKIFLDIVSQEIVTEHHTGQNQSDCYDYQVTYVTLNCQPFIDYCSNKKCRLNVCYLFDDINLTYTYNRKHIDTFSNYEVKNTYYRNYFVTNSTQIIISEGFKSIFLYSFD